MDGGKVDERLVRRPPFRRGPGRNGPGAAAGDHRRCSLAALGAAALIAVMLLAFLIGKGAGNNASPLPGLEGSARRRSSDERVVLTSSSRARAVGAYRSSRRDHLRAVLRARVPRWDAADRDCVLRTKASVFEKWGEPQRYGALLGVHESCAHAEGDVPAEAARYRPRPARTARSSATASASPTAVRVPGGPEHAGVPCDDGRDNDGDGLIDTEQHPGCEANSSEAGADAPLDPAPPAPGTGGTPPQTSTTPQTTTTPKTTTTPPPSTGGTRPRETHHDATSSSPAERLQRRPRQRRRRAHRLGAGSELHRRSLGVRLRAARVSRSAAAISAL